MQADTRGCGDAHTACCVHTWCLIERPLERDWVCVWRGAGGSGGGDGAGWHALRGRGKLRLIQCVPRTVRNGASLRRSSLDKVCRDNPPLQCHALQCSICSHELPMCVRGPMHVGVCGYACACARARTSSFIGSDTTHRIDFFLIHSGIGTAPTYTSCIRMERFAKPCQQQKPQHTPCMQRTHFLCASAPHTLPCLPKP